MYDIILWGATGFTGRQAARYFHQHYSAGTSSNGAAIKWAIAGRNRAKLEQTKQWLNAPDLEVFVVPGADAAAADNLACSTRVIAATVAPAAKYATEMVKACIKHGTDYCDLSGELHWIRAMIDGYDSQARAQGVKILNACGFDSIPSDLGVMVLQNAAKKRFGEYCCHIKNGFHRGHIAVSGGSFASGKGVMEAIAHDAPLADLIANPNSLNPRDAMAGNVLPELDKVTFDRDFDCYVMPFPMGGINTRIVRRAHSLTRFQYGEEFIYEEVKLAGKGIINKFKAQAETFVTKLFVEGNPDSRFTRILHGLGPKEGDGPSDEDIKRFGPFSFRLIGTTPSGKTIKGYVYSDWDPGHGGTAAMLCETAYCLAMERERINKVGGFTTTSIAMGEVLLQRLRHFARVEIDVGEWPSKS